VIKGFPDVTTLVAPGPKVTRMMLGFTEETIITKCAVLLPVAGGCEEGRQVKGGPSGMWSWCVWGGGGKSERGSEGGSNK